MNRVEFYKMKEPEMQKWITAHPGKVNELDGWGYPLLFLAARNASASFVAELLDTYGANVIRQKP